MIILATTRNCTYSPNHYEIVEHFVGHLDISHCVVFDDVAVHDSVFIQFKWQHVQMLLEVDSFFIKKLVCGLFGRPYKMQLQRTDIVVFRQIFQLLLGAEPVFHFLHRLPEHFNIDCNTLVVVGNDGNIIFSVGNADLFMAVCKIWSAALQIFHPLAFTSDDVDKQTSAQVFLTTLLVFDRLKLFSVHLLYLGSKEKKCLVNTLIRLPDDDFNIVVESPEYHYFFLLRISFVR